jgi:hypothetical protein
MHFDEDEFRYDSLNMFTAMLDDLEHLRMAQANRLRILTTSKDVLTVPKKEGKKGTRYGFGMNWERNGNILGPIDRVLTVVTDLEKESIKSVEHMMRSKTSPWREFLADPMTKGVGAKQLARLLGATGDPSWHVAQKRPRIVSELWAYSGYSVVEGAAQARRKGQKSNWSPDARSRARMIAESCLKTPGGHYAGIYYETKEHYKGAVHDRECSQCGTRREADGTPGIPALATTPLRDGHIHARALRAISKELLRDLWKEARRHRGLSVELGAPLTAVTAVA